MQQPHPLAEVLNATLQSDAPAAWRLLSERGRDIYFPSTGILGQTAEAKGVRYNATIGIALADDGSPLHMPAMEEIFQLPPADVFPYASSFGKPKLRSLWKDMLYQKNPSLRANVSLPVVTSGLTHGLSMAGYLFLDPGDTLIIPDQHWDNCGLIFEQAYRAQLSSFNTFADGGFDVAQMQEALMQGEPGKRVLLLNFPNNPSGYSPTRSEASAIAAALRTVADAGNDVTVILDDAYFGFAYEEDVYPESLISQLADLHERVLVCKVDGATKEDCAWGFRVGFLTFAGKGMSEQALQALEQKTAGAVRATVSCACQVTQSALEKLYASPAYLEQKEAVRTVLTGRYHEVRRVLADPKFVEILEPLPFNAGYFFCVRLKGGLDAETVRRAMLREHDAGCIALGQLLRIAFSSLPTQNIEPFFERLYAACTSS